MSPRLSCRHAFNLCVFSFVLVGFMSGTGMAQTDVPDGPPSFVSMAPVPLVDASGLSNPAATLEFPAGATTSKGSLPANDNSAASGPGTAGEAMFSGGKSSPIGGEITGLDTVPTFAGAFAGQSGPSLGVVFPFIMVGNDPRVGGTTHIPVQMTAVSLRLLNQDGSVQTDIPFAPFEDLTEDSPNFSASSFTSGHHIQFGDAVQRAEFFKSMEEDWHTVLDSPRIVNRVTITIPAFVSVRLPDGTTTSVQAYYLKHAPNGDAWVEVLDILFNSLNFGQAISDVSAGNFTTDAININMYPNTFLFSIDTKGNFSGCCVIGYHTYILQSGTTPQPRWLFNYASWISPGIFRGGVQDITALSHEISETLNDPFVNTATPRWEFPGRTTCQGNLETGDPVEVLPTSTVSITLRERREVFQYHPQTEALLQWFEMGAASDAIGGAFSYPDKTALPKSATPCPQ
jgi:hypothetical protein